MHTVIRQYTGENIRPLVDKLGDDLKETMSTIPGLRGYYMVYNDKGELATITVCDSKQGIAESNRRAAEWVKNNMPKEAKLSAPRVMEGETILEVAPKMAGVR
jgi:hypothetical protein